LRFSAYFSPTAGSRNPLAAITGFTKLLEKMKIITYIFLFILLVHSANAQQISETEIISIAEKFVADNGFTEAEAKRNEIDYELFESSQDIELILNNRKNTLHPKAYCILKSDRGWHVGFLSTSVNFQNASHKSITQDFAGRAITISPDGRTIRIAHKSPLFSKFKKI
jgi:hypothetical protein